MLKSEHIEDKPLDIDISCVLFRRSYLSKLKTESVCSSQREYECVRVYMCATLVHTHSNILYYSMSGIESQTSVNYTQNHYIAVYRDLARRFG